MTQELPDRNKYPEQVREVIGPVSFCGGQLGQVYSILTWRGSCIVSEAPSTVLGAKCLVNVMGR